MVCPRCISVRFSYAGDGLATTDGEPPKGFAVAGVDRKFHWAEAMIRGDSVVLASPDVPHPVAVRYAWANNPKVNLINSAGLPASPFRTDDWVEPILGR
jgi:sialate O-acetylesterase